MDAAETIEDMNALFHGIIGGLAQWCCLLAVLAVLAVLCLAFTLLSGVMDGGSNRPPYEQ